MFWALTLVNLLLPNPVFTFKQVIVYTCESPLRLKMYAKVPY